MTKRTAKSSHRRDFLKEGGALVAAGALAATAIPYVHAAEDGTLRVALIGCGGRGTGAASNAMSVKGAPTKLTAMADVFPARLQSSFDTLQQQFKDKMDVPQDRRFTGFSAYQQAMDCLRPGDIAIFATPPAFRWVHFSYAIERGINVFMEKPITVDGPSTRKMLALGEASVKKGLKVGVGLMCRHCEARGELFDRIQNGELGNLITLRCYRMHGPVGYAFSPPKPADMTDLMYQVQRFHSFLWASGGLYSDFYIHNIDECCWMKNEWPEKAQANGGRHFRGDNIDQNFDNYTVEYTFKDGSNMFLYGRTMPGCNDLFASYAHGSKGLGIISANSHWPSKARIYKGQSEKKEDLVWDCGTEPKENNPYQVEWDKLVEAVRDDKYHNEVQRGAEASLVTALGRMAAHTGQTVTFDEMLNCEHEFAPDLDKLTADSPAPLQPNADGKYSIPQPGITNTREY